MNHVTPVDPRCLGRLRRSPLGYRHRESGVGGHMLAAVTLMTAALTSMIAALVLGLTL